MQRGAVVILFVSLWTACSSSPSLPIGASWDPHTGLFRWTGGEVTLPIDLQYTRIESDTFQGDLHSDSGRLVIHHDIGPKAGAWAQQLNSTYFEERTVEGARVWIAQRPRGGEGQPETLVAVTFPDNGCANFFMVESEAPDRRTIEAIATSFRPAKTERAPTGTCEQRSE